VWFVNHSLTTTVLISTYKSLDAGRTVHAMALRLLEERCPGLEVCMTHFKFVLVALAVMGTAVCAAEPTTVPTAAENVAVNQAPYSSVLVLPFAPVAGASDWIGKGIQEDLATELVRQSRLNVLTPSDAQAVSDAADASKIGRDRGASLVAFGTYQVLDTDVRINGQLVDASTGKQIAALTATGPRRDLFHMEDLLAYQAVAALPPASVKPGGGAYASTASTNDAAATPTATASNYATQPYGSQGYYVTPGPDYGPTYDYTPASPNYDGGYSPYAAAYPYDYPYDYPYYGYNYPFPGDGFLFLGGYGYGGRYHDHGHDHGYGHGYNGTESHSLAGFGGARSPAFNQGSVFRSGGDGEVVRSSPSFHSAVGDRGFHAAAGGFRSGGIGGGGFRGAGGFGGGFHGGGGGHR
jgi:TolB-like protein